MNFHDIFRGREQLFVTNPVFTTKSHNWQVRQLTHWIIHWSNPPADHHWQSRTDICSFSEKLAGLSNSVSRTGWDVQWSYQVLIKDLVGTWFGASLAWLQVLEPFPSNLWWHLACNSCHRRVKDTNFTVTIFHLNSVSLITASLMINFSLLHFLDVGLVSTLQTSCGYSLNELFSCMSQWTLSRRPQGGEKICKKMYFRKITKESWVGR